MSMSTAAQQLQHAAQYGNHAAYTAATAIAARFSGLQEQLNACKQAFERRRQVADQALAAAVASLPVAQVQGAVDVALQLGLPGKQLAAALEAAHARDAAAAARVAAVVKAAAAAAQAVCELNPASSSSDAKLGSSYSKQIVVNSDGSIVHEFEAAVVACQQLGLACDVASARRAISQYQETLAVQLAAASDQATCTAVLQQVMQVCRGFGGLEQQISAAAGKLEQQQQQLVLQLQQRLGLNGAAAPGACEAAVGNHAEVQKLLLQAAGLGVAADVLDAMQQRLQAAQQAAAAQLQTAGETGSLTDIQKAAAAARQQGVEEQQVQQALQHLQQRRVTAGAELAAAAAACCTTHAQLSSSEADGSTCLQDLLTWVQMALHACTDKDNADSSGDVQLPTPTIHQQQQQQQQQEPVNCDDCHSSALQHQQQQQQLWHHAQACLKLGLVSNVVAALQAVAASCKAGLHKGGCRGLCWARR
jgi:hypothetical protein